MRLWHSPQWNTGWKSSYWASDAEFREENIRRDAEGKFTSGGAASGSPPSVSVSGGSGKSHRRDAPVKRVLESPLGWKYMEDEDGNSWSYSERRNGWVASQKPIGGEGWQDDTPFMKKELTGSQKGGSQEEMQKGLRRLARSKRIIPRS